MANIPYCTQFDAEAERVAGDIRVRRGGNLLNLDRMLLHCPALAEGWALLMVRIRKGYRVAQFDRELAICAVAMLTQAAYELKHHAPDLIAAGATQDQLDALKDVAAAAKNETLFDARARAVLALALDSTLAVKISETTLAAVKQAFPTPEDVFELVMIVASYNMVSRLLVGLGVEIEGTEMEVR